MDNIKKVIKELEFNANQFTDIATHPAEIGENEGNLEAVNRLWKSYEKFKDDVPKFLEEIDTYRLMVAAKESKEEDIQRSYAYFGYHSLLENFLDRYNDL